MGEEGEYGFPRHLPFFACFRWAHHFQKVQKLAKPQPIPWSHEELCQEAKEAKTAWLETEGERLIAQATRDWEVALGAHDTETLWRIW